MMLGRISILLAVLVLLSVGLASTAGADNELEVVKAFDASQQELPEGVAVDKFGNIYVSLGLPFELGSFGEVRRINPDGTETVLVAGLETGPTGLAVDKRGNVYYGYPTSDDDARGVHRVLGGGATVRLPGTENILLPNGLGFDNRGNLYVSDSVRGAIWRIPPQGTAELWIEDDSLEGCEIPGSGFPPIGANGVAYHRHSLYVANSDQGLLLRIPIENGGVPGDLDLVVGEPGCAEGFEDDELYSMDGIAFDARGGMYALLVLQNKLVRIDVSTGDVTELVNGSGFHNPASLAFGTRSGERGTLFISNFALLPPAPPDSLGPAVLKLNVGPPGKPSP